MLLSDPTRSDECDSNLAFHTCARLSRFAIFSHNRGPGKLELIQKVVIGRRFAPSILNAESYDPFGEMFAQDFSDQSTKTSIDRVLFDGEYDRHRLTSLDNLLLIDRLDRRHVQNAGRNSLFRQVLRRFDAANALRTG